MKIVKDPSLSLLHQVFGWRGKDRLSVAVLSGFSLNDGGPIGEAEMWDRVTAALGRNGVLDLSMPKPKGEVLVLGKCFARDGREVRGATAFFRVGRLEKRVEVFGDRYFKLGLIGSTYIKPKPFTEMDIVWENAFGGPGYGPNPVGKGMTPVHTDKGDRLIPIPNIEKPERLITSPDDRPQPAGFGPMGLDWPARLKELGTFDQRWLAERWPGLPDDFNFGYFNLAPLDQRLDGFFEGNEFVLIRGMHPERHEFQTRLPDLRCRLFVNQVKDDVEEFKEISTNLDTVYLIPHMEMGLLIRHGVTITEDDEAGDVGHIAAFYEPRTEEPKALEFYRAKLDEPAEEEPVELEPPFEEPESEEEAEPPEPAPQPPEIKIPAEAAALAVALENQVAKTEGLLNQRLREWGVNPDEIRPAPAPETPPAPAEDVSPDKLLAQLEESTAEKEKELDGLLRDLGVDPDAPPPDQPASLPEASDLSTAEAFVGHFRKTGVSDPGILGELRGLFMEHQAAIAELTALGSTMAQAPDPEPVTGPVEEGPPDEPEPVTRRQVLNGFAAGESFAHSDLSGLDLSDCELPGIDLAGAVLENTNFSRSNLTEAGFDGAILTGADLTRARLTGAGLSGITASGAGMSGADLAGANLSGSDLSGVDFSEARLTEADLTDSVMTETILIEADCNGLKAPNVDFGKADLKKATFIKADLAEADMTGVSMDEANLSLAKAKDLRLYGANGQNVDFRAADLRQSRAGEGASLPGALFSRTDLSGASWEDTDVTGADFSGANMQKAQMNQCRFEGTILSAVNARSADFSKSDFLKARMTAIDLLGGSLRKATLTETDLRAANLHGVDFYKAVLSGTKLEGANLDRTLLTLGKSMLK